VDPFGPCDYGRLASVATGRFGHVLNRARGLLDEHAGGHRARMTPASSSTPSSIGCIQAQRCHTGRCPSGVATQSRWLMHGLDPELKSSQAANYLVALRAELLALARSCGVPHPALVGPEHIEIITDSFHSASLTEIFGYEPQWPPVADWRRAEMEALVGMPR
jgi:hypothetical protein